ncbi:poly-gamma-glutamate hydrolase family protein [Natrialba sp. SSL1]|uniref:poly-gamma-glutamate hydrolase family protein n=1 Tax=Natrialba sp. SSL1 TaxID=1869245 RepID=UPI00209B2510|nr:poly-gamma-glutamate hydrolase family protein [Natrialba sp. SSL1]
MTTPLSCNGETTYWDRTVEEVDDEWTTRAATDRYCSLPCELLDSSTLEIGQQIRLFHDAGGGFANAIYTIASDHDSEHLWLTDHGLDRIGAGDGDTLTVGQLATHPNYETRQSARLNDEYAEYLVGDDDDVDGNDDTAATDVLALAPHGGYVEYGTDWQAKRVVDTAGGLAWICAGFNDGGGALDRWHVHSTDIHHASFPVLNDIRHREFEWSVAFHGYTSDAILVGGTASEDDRALVATALEEALPETPVELASSDATSYAGAAPENVLNEVGTIGQTIQLEQPMNVRQEQWAAVADAVASALEELH